MKLVRWLLIFGGVLLVLAGGLLGLALVPSVQRWAALHAVGDIPGLRVTLAEIDAGFSGVKLSGLEVEKDRVVLRAERLEADFSPLALLLHRELHVTRLATSGLTVDASRVSRARTSAAAAGAPVAAPGLLARVQLPFALSLDDVRVDGRAVLAGSPGPLQAEFALTGGKLAPGQEGLLQFTATVHDGSPGAKVTTLRAQAGLRLTLTPQRTFGKVGLTAVVDPEGPGLTGANQLKVAAELYHSSGGENYTVAVDTLQRGASEPLLRLRASLPAGSSRYAGEWDLRVRHAQIEPYSLGRALPEFAATGAGDFFLDAAAAGFGLHGQLQAQVSRLEALNPAWKNFGALKLDASLNLAQRDSVVSIDELRVALAGEAPVLELRSLAPVRYDRRQRRLQAADGAAPDLLRVTLAGVPLAWLHPLLPGVEFDGRPLTGSFDVGRGVGSPTSIALRGRLQLADFNLSTDGRPLLARGTVELGTEATIDGDALEARTVDLRIQSPDGDAAHFAGRLSTALGADAPLTLAGRFSGSSAQHLARWLPGAPVTLAGDFNLTKRGKDLALEPGMVALQQAGKDLFKLAVLQRFSLDCDQLTVTPADAAQPLARLEASRVPLAWLPVTEPDAVLGGTIQQADLELVQDAGKLVARARGPVRLADVSLTQSRRPALAGLAIELAPRVELAGGGAFALQTGDVSVRHEGKTLATARLEVSAAVDRGTQASATFTVELPWLGRQPLFADAQAVSAGRATGEVRAVLAAQRQVEARVTLNGLVTAEGGRILPVANLGFRGLVQPDGSMALQAPILLDSGGRRSDLNFALQLSPLGRGYSIDGRLTGQQVELEDAQGLLAVFLGAAAPAGAEPGAAAPANTAPDTEAAWSRFSGQLGVDVKNITHGQEWAMTGLAGTLAIEPARLVLPKLEASFGETSRLLAKMEIRFTGGAMPYRLTGSYTLNDFDAGRLFRALEASKTPTIEGLFTINSQFSGNGETPARALERMQGDFQLTSRQGVFRGLQRTSNKLSMTSKAVELGASVLGSILGSDKATRTAEKVAGQAYFVDQLAQQIGELKYDLLSVKLSRDELLTMNLGDFSLLSSEMRLNGRGTVTYVAGKPLLEQPLSASLEMAARGKTEEILGKLRLLSGTKDDLGYAKARETVTIGGTLAKPDPSAFFTRIATAKLADFLD